jgi:TonB family protein
MFATLVVSRPTGRLSPRGLMVAALVHAAILAAAIQATARVAGQPQPSHRDTILLFSPMRSLPTTPRVSPRSTDSPGRFHPEPPRFSPPSLSPERLDVPPVTFPDIGSLLAAVTKGRTDSVGESARDALQIAGLNVEPPTLLAGPEIRYPPALARADVSGRVQLSFVIDVSGLVDSASLKVLHADHPEFAAAAREAILASRFSPGRRLGKPVAVLVTQVVGFQKR